MKQQQGISEAEYLRQIMANSKPHVCTNCAGIFFKQVYTMRSVSRIFTGSPEDSLLPLPMWRCDDCGSPVEKLNIPESQEAKPTPPKSNLITE